MRSKDFRSILILLLLSYTRAFSNSNSMKGSVYIALTVDGFIATPDGNVDFLIPYQQSAEDDMGFFAFLKRVDVIIMGRNSFEKVVSFGKDAWPYDKIPLVVWSRQGTEIPDYCRDSVSCSSLSPNALMSFLESKGHKHAYIDGGKTIQHFLKAKQIHNFILTRVPILLGEGIPLFEEGDQVPLVHTKTKAYKNGLVMSYYDVKEE